MSFFILGLLGLIFITLKLTGHIAWSWVWVLAPFWVGVVLFLVVFIVSLFAVWLAAGRIWLGGA